MEHCKDCCCAQSWAALGIVEYTGMSIPEHIEKLKKENERLQTDVTHWKANHADLKNRLAFATQRPDLPVDRIPAYERLQRERDELDARLTLECDLHGKTMVDLANERKRCAGIARYKWRKKTANGHEYVCDVAAAIENV